MTFSLDPRLLQMLQTILPLDVFIETGTFMGEAVETAAPYFKEIFSVEFSPEYYQKAAEKFKNNAAINIVQGNSAEVLANIAAKAQHRPVFYWLDAHWCVADKTAGKYSQCPLLQELQVIQSLNEQSIIAIDDARLFLAPPPIPHEILHWPSFDSILKTLYNLSDKHSVIVLNDNILFVPKAIEAAFGDYAYNNGIDWLNALDKGRDYDKLLVQLQEKEELIHKLSIICEERMSVISKLQVKFANIFK